MKYLPIPRSTFLASVLLASTCVVGQALAEPSDAPGTLVRVEPSPLDKSLQPVGTSQGYKVTYYSTDAFGNPALSTGAIYLPSGEQPAGGWPVISWAHGTSGVGDDCAPSDVGPSLPDRDLPYLGKWLAAGYAIVATDYVGLGTPGLHAYLEGKSSTHAIVDMVKAARNYGADKGANGSNLFSNKWAVVGQSQGAGAAIYAARYATEFGGPELDYRGGVGTGTPAFTELLPLTLGPLTPPLPVALTGYISYIIDGLREVHPEIDWDSALTEKGKAWLETSKTECIEPLEDDLREHHVSINQYFKKPLFLVSGSIPVMRDYLSMPVDGFDKPIFLGQGSLDIDVPYVVTGVPYQTILKLNHQPVTFKTYWGLDHSGTLVASPEDTIPFVNNLMADDK